MVQVLVNMLRFTPLVSGWQTWLQTQESDSKIHAFLFLQEEMSTGCFGGVMKTF